VWVIQGQRHGYLVEVIDSTNSIMGGGGGEISESDMHV